MGFLAHSPQLVLDIRWMRSNAAIPSQSAMLLLASSRRGPDQMLHSPLTTAAAAAQWVNSNDTCDTKLLSSGLKKRRRLSSLLLLLDVMHAIGRCNVLYIRSIPLKVVQELMTSVYILRTHTSQEQQQQQLLLLSILLICLVSSHCHYSLRALEFNALLQSHIVRYTDVVVVVVNLSFRAK